MSAPFPPPVQPPAQPRQPQPRPAPGQAARFETWAGVLLVLLALAAPMALGQWLADDVLPGRVPDGMIRLQDGAEGLTVTSAVLWPAGLAIAAAGWLGFGRVRRVASGRYVERSLRERSYDPWRSPAPRWTAAQWLSLTLGLGLTYAATVFGAAPDPEAAELAAEARSGSVRALAAAALAGAVVFFAWRFRRRVEVAWMLHAGVLVPATAPEPPATVTGRFTLGAQAFAKNLLIGGIFLALGWGQAVLDGAPPAREKLVDDALASFVVLPVGFSLGLVVAFWLSPARWMVRESLRHPSSRAALGLLGVGTVLNLVVPGPVALTLLGLSFLVISVTLLHLMDLGPQPWLGILWLLASYVFGLVYSVEAGGSQPLSWPAGPLNWVAAVGTLVLVVLDVGRQWRDRYGVAAGPAAAGGVSPGAA